MFHQKINPFHAIGLFLYPLKTSENQRFFNVFRGYSMKWKPVAWNGSRGAKFIKQIAFFIKTTAKDLN